MYDKIIAKFRTEVGATATEYVLLLVGVALLVIFGALFLGNALDDTLSEVGTYVNNASVPN